MAHIEKVTATHLVIHALQKKVEPEVGSSVVCLCDFGDPPFLVAVPLSMLWPHVEGEIQDCPEPPTATTDRTPPAPNAPVNNDNNNNNDNNDNDNDDSDSANNNNNNNDNNYDDSTIMTTIKMIQPWQWQ